MTISYDLGHILRMPALNKEPKKLILIILGSAALLIGIIGIFVPLLPTTPFVLLSAWCFANSSPRFHQWLIQHKYFGRMIKDWQESGSISKSAKLIASITLLISAASVLIKVDNLILKTSVVVFLFLVLGFILTRPNS